MEVLLTTKKEGSMDKTSVFSFFNVPHGLFILSIVPGIFKFLLYPQDSNEVIRINHIPSLKSSGIF